MYQPPNKSLTNKLTEAWVASNYFVSINGCELREPDILDLEIMFGGCTVHGILTFQDSQGLMQGTPKGTPSLAVGGHVRVGWESALGCGGEYEETFSIEKVRSETNEKNQRLVILDLVDLETKNYQGTNLTKPYKEKKFSEALKEHTDEINKNINTVQKRVLKIIGHAKEAIDSIVIPSHIDFHTFLNISLPNNGYEHKKDKHTSYIVSKQTTEFDKLKTQKEEFEVDTVNEFSFWRILQYNLEGFDVNALIDSIPIGLTTTTKELKGEEKKDMLAKDMIVDHKKTIEKGGAGSTNQSDMIVKRGTKRASKKNINMQQYYTSLSNAQKCSIWVPGVNRNRIGFRVQVAFPRPQYMQGDSYDNVFSGEWEVVAVRDKIIKQYFVQELFLRRPGGATGG